MGGSVPVNTLCDPICTKPEDARCANAGGILCVGALQQRVRNRRRPHSPLLEHCRSSTVLRSQTMRWKMIGVNQQSIEDQIAELRSQIAEVKQAVSEGINSAAEGASGIARNAAQTVRQQGQGAIEAARENPGTATTIVALIGFCIGLYLGLSSTSGVRARW